MQFYAFSYRPTHNCHWQPKIVLIQLVRGTFEQFVELQISWKMFKQQLIFVILIFVRPNRITAHCCHQSGFVYHECANVPHETKTKHLLSETEKRACLSYVCGDGSTTPKYQYCGHGPCNLFGCNCDGGCRNADASREQAIKLFRIRYGIEFTEYECPEFVNNPNNVLCQLEFS